MPDFLISYDLESESPDAHKPFLIAAEKEGLIYVVKAGSFLMRLPNTTIWGEFGDMDKAIGAFDRALAAASKVVGYTINLEKRVLAPFDTGKVNSNVSKTPETKWTDIASNFRTSRQHQVNDPFFK